MGDLLESGLNLVRGAGPFFYPLLLCSLVATYIVCERFYVLRRARVLPSETVDAVLEGRAPQEENVSVLGRIARFAADAKHDEDAVRAFARLEINRMERGFVFLEVVVGVAPMFGLMGTVTALIRVFGAIQPESGAAAQGALTQGISLALSTTVLGLLVAIPALFCSSLLQRRVETYAVQLDSLLQRIASGRKAP